MFWVPRTPKRAKPMTSLMQQISRFKEINLRSSPSASKEEGPPKSPSASPLMRQQENKVFKEKLDFENVEAEKMDSEKAKKVEKLLNDKIQTVERPKRYVYITLLFVDK